MSQASIFTATIELDDTELAVLCRLLWRRRSELRLTAMNAHSDVERDALEAEADGVDLLRGKLFRAREAAGLGVPPGARQ